MENRSLEQIIRSNVRLYPQNNNGWWPCLHHACDSGRRGPRAAFRFNGDAVEFNCFNCGTHTGFNPSRDDTLSFKMQQILKDFNVSQEDINLVIFSYYGKNKQHAPIFKPKTYEPDTIDVPKWWKSIHDDKNDLVALEAIDTLIRRQIDPFMQPFFVSDRNQTKNNSHLKKWDGRLIIPIYKDGQLIFYQGRDLTQRAPEKYLSCNHTRTNIIHGFDRLKEDTTLPIYVCEGWFDAEAIGGVAIFGRKMTEGQIYWLNQSRRPKVVIPDTQGKGSQDLPNQAIKLGWSVAVPDCPGKDIAEAVYKYGLFYVLKSIKENTKQDFEAQLLINMFCEK